MSDTPYTLDRLPLGMLAKVRALRAEGAERARLLDLGLVVGTDILALFRSPSGNPVAYLIRGAVIALRTDASRKIVVSAP